MGLTLDQCVERIKDVYPGMSPVYWILYDGKYIFNIVSDDQIGEYSVADFHVVNPEDGGVSASIPLDMLADNDEIVSLLKKPNKINKNKAALKHGLKKKLDNYDGPYYAVIRTGSNLCHHGIKGQKWGVRRFQNEDGSLTNEGRERYGYKAKIKKVADGPQGMDPVTAYYAAQAATIAAFCIGTSIYAKVKKNKDHVKFKKDNDAISEDYLSDISDFKEFSDNNKPKNIVGKHSIEDDMAAVNPKYGQAIKGNTNNCVLCSLTYDLRRRGYDVTSKLCSTGMYTDKVLNEVYKDAKLINSGSYNWTSVAKKCEKMYPEGSRGLIAVSGMYGGHAMAFEIHDGKMNIYDAQSAQRRSLTDSALRVFDPQYTKTVRLDNKEVNWSGANIVCSELKSDWKKTIASQKTAQNAINSTSPSSTKVAAGSKIVMNTKQILAYKKEHPNTKLTDKEIWKTITGG